MFGNTLPKRPEFVYELEHYAHVFRFFDEGGCSNCLITAAHSRSVTIVAWRGLRRLGYEY